MTGDVLGLDEVHVLGRQAHGLPVEAAFEQEGPAGVGGALEALLRPGRSDTASRPSRPRVR